MVMFSIILRKLRERRLAGKVIGCSKCFDDIGLRKVAEDFGDSASGSCPNCGLLDGAKLTRNALELTCNEFFVRGSVFSGTGWFAPMLQFNYSDRPIDEVGREALRKDIRLLSEAFGLNIFLYGPPLWMFGKPAEEDGKQRWEASDYQKICDYHEKLELDSNATFFRVQRNIEFTPEDTRFCSPPEKFRTVNGRFDSPKLPVLYCSFDVETCLHESRVSLEDDIFVATMQPTKTLRLLDLTSPKVDFYISPFDDPRIWLKSLIYDHDSYDCCQHLALHIRSLGYDGFVIESYFQQAARAKHANLCLFDRPVVSGSVRVLGVNKVILHNVSYEFGFGPAVFSNELFVDEEQLLTGDEISPAVETG
ncbi:RES family NAD+ phosphorylase [Mameliella sediminis]|uniref:RES family NAD+ phosphorylase n=1 Tax=Mameliella sediminis TaxID=2836866 RepID=UPI001C45C9DD|nr:RES family NAD+ phosphorylase [Mameliella sediminis]MBV7396167.1 RES family NAD+ phosphorylase [Mameliella sediminis]